jgi:dTDP-4-amino-4,6-dideoxygalactose transaminase
MNDALAIHGGPPSISKPLPNFLSTAGRTFGVEEEALVIEALRSGCLSRNGGTMVKGLERDFASALGVTHAVACSSGTASIHLAIAALDLEPGDEVIVPPITDIGTILPILWQNAVPVFADVDPLTMVLAPSSVKELITISTRAVIAVHLAGMPCPMDELLSICRQQSIPLIEDCSQAYWAIYKDKLVGTMGDMACFSLQQSKHMSCGEGGLLVTSNDDYARRALLFSDKAWPRESTSLGSARFLFLSQNYRMGELAGAVAWAQLKKVQDTVASRRGRADELSRQIAALDGIYAPFTPNGINPAYWLYMLRVTKAANTTAEEFGAALVAEGVPAWVRYIVDPLYLSPIFTTPMTYGTSGYPFSQFPHQRFERGLCPNAEAALSQTIAIHWNENYTVDQVVEIASAIKKVARYYATAKNR